MRRIFASVMSVLFVGVFTICPAFAASSFPDVDKNADYAEAVAYVSENGIMVGDGNGNFNPNKVVTRAEMATIICRMLAEDISKIDGTVFDDVPEDHWANGFVIKAFDLGIISGYPDGNFGPSDPVTYEQAMTMIVRALGVEDVAIEMGGYPFGYISAAEEYGYTNMISAKLGDLMERWQVAIIVCNTQF